MKLLLLMQLTVGTYVAIEDFKWGPGDTGLLLKMSFRETLECILVLLNQAFKTLLYAISIDNHMHVSAIKE